MHMGLQCKLIEVKKGFIIKAGYLLFRNGCYRNSDIGILGLSCWHRNACAELPIEGFLQVQLARRLQNE